MPFGAVFGHKMDLVNIKRQQFLTPQMYETLKAETLNTIETFKVNPTGVGDSLEERWVYSYAIVAENYLNLLLLEYTAGNSLPFIRSQLEIVIDYYEQYGSKLRSYHKNINLPVFELFTIDGYCPCIWLISLCYLLHRKDLLPRVAKLIDGEMRENVAQDWLIEEYLSFSDENRYDCSTVLVPKPYLLLCEAFSNQDNEISLAFVRKFLKNWYKDLSGAPWHDTHKSEGGYYGYWAFEAACAVILLEIENDTVLHEYLYYPKDLVEFYHKFKLKTSVINFLENHNKFSIKAGEKCPQQGYWFTVAKVNSRQYFNLGDVFPNFESDWGDVYWQFDGEE